MWHFFLVLRFIAIHKGIFALFGGRKGPYAPCDLVQRTSHDFGESVGRTEINAVRSMEMRGIISMSSSEAMSSSSGGVIEFRKETGNAILVAGR
jgi:hypothetical protein